MDICVEALPQPALRPFVECIWYSAASGGTRFDIVPDGCVDACFVLSERRPRTLVFGTTTRTSAYEMEAAPYFGVRFRPGSASMFVRERIVDLTDAVHELPALLSLSAEHMVATGTMAKRRLELERALMRALAGIEDRGMPVLRRAIEMIDRRQGAVRVRELAAQCNLSERQLERLFEDQVGVGPKLYARIRRFRAVLDRLEDPPEENASRLAEIAAAFGYVDQSHMARDFRDFSYRMLD